MERTINIGRMEEIATMALHKLMEIDSDMGQRFMIEEINMSKDETDNFGVTRIRTATDIEWDVEDEDGFGVCESCKNSSCCNVCSDCHEGSEYETDYESFELPTEVKIPWNVFDDDIDDWLSDEYGYCVSGFDLEEEDEEETDRPI